MDPARVQGPKQSSECRGWSSLHPMDDFCSHFGVLAALPRRPMSASLGQGPSKLDQSVRQMGRFGRKGRNGQNISIYHVLQLSRGPGSALDSSRALPEASQKPSDSFLAARKDKVSFGIYGNGRKWTGMDGNGRKWTQTHANKPKPKPDQRSKSI